MRNGFKMMLSNDHDHNHNPEHRCQPKCGINKGKTKVMSQTKPKVTNYKNTHTQVDKIHALDAYRASGSEI